MQTDQKKNLTGVTDAIMKELITLQLNKKSVNFRMEQLKNKDKTDPELKELMQLILVDVRLDNRIESISRALNSTVNHTKN